MGQKPESEVTRRLLAGAVGRAAVFCWLAAIGFGQLSFTTLEFLQRIDPDLTLWSNTWPRILFGTLPWMGLGWFLKRAPARPHLKLAAFYLVHGLLFIAAGMTHVWPAVLSGHPAAILYVAAANGAFFFSTWTLVAPPPIALTYAGPLYFALTAAPLYWVTFKSNDVIIAKLVMNDSISISLMGMASGYFFHRVYRQLESLALEKEQQARSFLGKTVAEAIYNDKQEALQDRVRNGFVLIIDIRESSKLARELGESWNHFVDRWFDVATRVSDRYLGALTKTGGDSVIITFGVLNGPAELPEIEGLDIEIREATEKRWEQLTENAVFCIDALFEAFEALRLEHLPERDLLLGAGLDRGPVGCGVRGNELRKELDIWGDRVNCAARLQDYSKVISQNLGERVSVAVISPYATDYLANPERFRKQSTQAAPIRDFGGISWVLYKAYASARSSRTNQSKAGSSAA